jgi:hypothetical protein
MFILFVTGAVRLYFILQNASSLYRFMAMQWVSLLPKDVLFRCLVAYSVRR